MSDLDEVYRERAHLVALMAACWPSVISTAGDPDWPVIYIKTPAGQLSWHIARPDLDRFRHVRVTSDAITWDGHSTAEKYERVAALTKRIADLGGV